MNFYTIIANNQEMGQYLAHDGQNALDLYAMDAGYRDYADVVAQFGNDATAFVDWSDPRNQEGDHDAHLSA